MIHIDKDISWNMKFWDIFCSGIRTSGTLDDLIKFLHEKGYKHIPRAHKVNKENGWISHFCSVSHAVMWNMN